MDWNAIGAIGEAFGAIALFLVLAQVRHARDEVRRSVSQGRLEAASQIAEQYIANERLNTLQNQALSALGVPPDPFSTMLMERAGMTREEAATLTWSQQVWWIFRARMIAQIDRLPPQERVEFDDATRSLYRDQPLFSLWYQSAKDTLPNKSAVRYVEGLLAQAD
jgi:hypothetical protein